jgi:histidinol-phosphate/aromatic aminotransferase/cobyric acid decarboxylase-like protein
MNWEASLLLINNAPHQDASCFRRGPRASATGYVTREAGSYDGRNGPPLDLGLAVSPIGPAPELQESLRQRDPLRELSAYPDDPYQRETRAIVLKGIGVEGLTPESLLFAGNGSYGAGDEVIRYVHHLGYTTVFVPAYSFPNVSQWAARHLVEHSPLHPVAHHPLVSLQQVLSMNRDTLRGTIIYVDYPNNPFGSADPEVLRRVVDHVVAMQGLPLVDLAFGEVLGDEWHQAMQYTLSRGGICLGSLSKTQGLPGLRAGYALLPPDLASGYAGAQQLVFGISSEADYIYRRLFECGRDGSTLARRHAEQVARYNVETNAQLVERLQRLGLEVGGSDPRTPIQVVISPDAHFHQKLLQQGIITESLRDYRITLGDGPGYQDAAVRMVTPGPGQLEEVLRRIALAMC